MSKTETLAFGESSPEVARIAELTSEFMESIHRNSVNSIADAGDLEIQLRNYVSLNYPDVHAQVKSDTQIYWNALWSLEQIRRRKSLDDGSHPASESVSRFAFEFEETSPEFKRITELAVEYMKSIGREWISNGTEGDYMEAGLSKYVEVNYPDDCIRVQRDPSIYWNVLWELQQRNEGANDSDESDLEWV